MGTLVFFQNKMYRAFLPTRESMFSTFREMLPNDELTLFEVGTEKIIRVKVKDVLLYSEWENRQKGVE